MKITLFIVVLLAVSVAFYSCSSPTDVHANRQIVYQDDPNEVLPELEINLNELIFYDVPYLSSQSKSFRLRNLTDKWYRIDTISFKHYPELLSVWAPDFPFSLAPNGHDSSSREIFLAFFAGQTGEFIDSIMINGKIEPTMKLHSIVPIVDVFDLDFGFQIVNSTKFTPPLYVTNNSQSVAKITDFKLFDPDDVFKIKSQLPIEILPGRKQPIILSFTPKTDKPYSGRIEFKIEGVNGFIDNIAELNGTGIK